MARIEYRSINQTQIDNFALSTFYQDTVPNPADPTGPPIPNPITKLRWMEQFGRGYLEGQMALGKKMARQAARVAEDAADADSIELPPGDVVA